MLKLQNVLEPNLFRDTFSYERIPAMKFMDEAVPMRRPEQIWIVELYKFMHRISGSHGLIRQSEFFLYGQKDREAVEACLALGYDFP